ncbi:hypothetical protein PILCRDRAFT_9492 [Piloderma croceum F 1598]|uniref:Uncharacterized protein n=1 Tax=Piloderma croceum (strain F 1598) TaxID=765440 RepID=A0A0C3BTQ6_PILCF|nr:hypothetical protein PILCRDRAFT_9492 [Piloderma croceum F 1598]
MGTEDEEDGEVIEGMIEAHSGHPLITPSRTRHSFRSSPVVCTRTPYVYDFTITQTLASFLVASSAFFLQPVLSLADMHYGNLFVCLSKPLYSVAACI